MEEEIHYLSGPMSGYPDHNFPLFADVAKRLRDAGYQIRSPHESQAITDHGTNEPYEFYIRKDVEMMLECNSIIMLPGWMQSKGARIELNLALDLNFGIKRLASYTETYHEESRPRTRISLMVVSIDDGLYDQWDRI